jgi:hypothetical protein
LTVSKLKTVKTVKNIFQHSQIESGQAVGMAISGFHIISEVSDLNLCNNSLKYIKAVNLITFT